MIVEKTIEIGKLTKVVTKDGRTYIGTLTGYAEVGTGDEVIEELYLKGLGELKVLSVHQILDVDQELVSFVFKPISH